jgi:hypothetical protein
MTDQDVNIIISYLRKAIVPASEHEAFLKAFENLQSLIYQPKQAA